MVRTVHSSLEQEVRFCSKTIFRFLGCMPTSGPVRSLPSIRNWSDFSAQFVETSFVQKQLFLSFLPSFLPFSPPQNRRRSFVTCQRKSGDLQRREERKGKGRHHQEFSKRLALLSVSKVEKLNPVRNIVPN